MKYTRLYADPVGETPLEDVDVDFNDGQIRSGGPTMDYLHPSRPLIVSFLKQPEVALILGIITLVHGSNGS